MTPDRADIVLKSDDDYIRLTLDIANAIEQVW
jgi:hypothetical protein